MGKLLDNPIVLTVFLCVIIGIIGMVFNILRLMVDMRFTGAVSVVAGSLIVGNVYSHELKKGMGKKLRAIVSLYYVVVQLVLGPIFMVLVGLLTDIIFWVIFLALVPVHFLLIYLFLGIGSGFYRKTKRKRK